MQVSTDRRIVLSQDGPKNGLRPAISYLFQSVARVFRCDAAGVLLTGMGKDGAQELRLLRDTGAVTIVQDQDSAVVYGMPGEAIRLDAATYVLPPERIAARLAWLADKKGTEP
jgi:two-component system, chemotaxis family, protein-glutamate methylesterase/glutaminase